MRRTPAALPLFHDTVTIPLRERPEGLRVVINDAGLVLRSLVSLFLAPKHQNKSATWQQKAARAVGLLYDYFRAVPEPRDLLGRRAFLSGFAQALMAGTVDQTGGDETGLYWRPMSWSRVEETLQYVNLFADHCVSEYGAEDLNPYVDGSFGDRVARMRRLDVQNRNSLLKHLGTARAKFDEVRGVRGIRARRRPKVSPRKPPYFPRDAFAPLLQEGFARKRTGAPWERWNIRDMMIAILQRHGGLRVSEPFHLFVTDVHPDPRAPTSAEVRLYHPELGRFAYRDPISGLIRRVTRTEYLRDAHGRVPRNRIAGKEGAGWKNLMLDEGEPEMYALVRWFPAEWGQVFLQLYRIYVRHLLPARLDHPYLFVALQGGAQYGKPYKTSAYTQSLTRAVKRIGLDPAKVLGTTTHGFRHGYGQDLADAELDEKTIQICLHHNSATSQQVYTRPEQQRIQRELDAARRKLAGEHGSSLSGLADLLGLPSTT